MKKLVSLFVFTVLVFSAFSFINDNISLAGFLDDSYRECKNIGFKEGTEKFAICIHKMEKKKHSIVSNLPICEDSPRTVSSSDKFYWSDCFGIATLLLSGSSSSAENTYVGEWKDYKLHGNGVIHLGIANDLYNGSWRNDKRDGRGTYIWSDGGKYVGGWMNGNREGHGTQYWNDGRVWVGNWSNHDWVNGHQYTAEEYQIHKINNAVNTTSYADDPITYLCQKWSKQLSKSMKQSESFYYDQGRNYHNQYYFTDYNKCIRDLEKIYTAEEMRDVYKGPPTIDTNIEGIEIYKFALEEEGLGNYNEAIKLLQQCYASNIQCRERIVILRKQLKSANNEEKPKEIATNNVAQKDVDKNTILSVQKILVKFGYKLGNPDGVMGKQTVKAIKEYQKVEGMNQTGIIDNNLIISLKNKQKTTNTTISKKEVKQEPDISTNILLQAPKEEDIGKLNDLVLCQHHYVRPSPQILKEVKKRYLKCDRLLEIANTSNKKSQTISSENIEIDLIDEKKTVDTEKIEREKRRQAKLEELREIQRRANEAEERQRQQRLKEQELIMQQQALERVRQDQLEIEKQRLELERRRVEAEERRMDYERSRAIGEALGKLADEFNPPPMAPTPLLRSGELQCFTDQHGTICKPRF